MRAVLLGGPDRHDQQPRARRGQARRRCPERSPARTADDARASAGPTVRARRQPSQSPVAYARSSAVRRAPKRSGSRRGRRWAQSAATETASAAAATRRARRERRAAAKHERRIGPPRGVEQLVADAQLRARRPRRASGRRASGTAGSRAASARWRRSAASRRRPRTAGRRQQPRRQRPRGHDRVVQPAGVAPGQRARRGAVGDPLAEPGPGGDRWGCSTRAVGS